ncbi:MAG: UDP-N-acetylmuramate--L-alanine ligase [Clostridia bacterium]|nr:UDP-N-acetylmuramate--L-alanine ligase [Clostridia bacterium]
MNIDEALSKFKRIHFIGIGGAGMCPLAEILHEKGYILTGSDNNESDNLKRIRSLGIPVYMGQRPENLGDSEAVVYTAALLDTNPELVAAKASRPTFERRELLGAVTRQFGKVVGVAGTHGKTTTSSMITQAFMDAGRDPSAVIGGRLPSIDAHGRVGKEDLLVVESCEFARTFLDETVSVAVLLNVDRDHLDVYKTMDNLTAAFSQFVSGATECVVYNGDDPRCVKAVEPVRSRALLSFGLDRSNNYSADGLYRDDLGGYGFTLYVNGHERGRVELAVPGKHNVFNALAAIAVCSYMGMELDKIVASLAEFRGADRRFQLKGEYNGAKIYDDYAHHPAEIEATLTAAKELDFKRVIAVFQPFTFSRTYTLLDDFARVLEIADEVVLTPIMGSREVNTYNIHTSDLTEKIPCAKEFKSFSEVREYLAGHVGEGDLVITLGCGDVYKIGDMLLA